jgi:hypothetical protein
VNSEIRSTTVTERVWRCTCQPQSSELTDALGGRDRSSLEKDWVAVIERIADPFVAGYDRARLEVVDLEAVGGRLARC